MTIETVERWMTYGARLLVVLGAVSFVKFTVDLMGAWEAFKMWAFAIGGTAVLVVACLPLTKGRS